MTAPTSGESSTGLLGGRYRLGRMLGAGGMADVHVATDVALERQVAVKVLRPIAGGDLARERFIGEARMLAGLSHTGLVTVLDAGFDAERPFLVMELVEGPTLAEVCAHGRCDGGQAQAVGAQVAEALAFVHARGIVHRDVKPANVLIDGNGRVKLADFGIARLAGRDAGLTRSGIAMGTVAYVSPEQVRGGTLTPAADVYSLGLVLLEVLTGRKEYPGSDLGAAQARLSSPPHIPGQLSEPWPRLLAAMTAEDPAQRPSAVEVADRINRHRSAPIPTTQVLPAAVRTVPLPPAGSLSEGEQATGPMPMADRLGNSLHRQLRAAGRRSAAVSTQQRVLAGTALVMVAFLVTAGVAGGSSRTDRTDVPADTPSDLREPLADLHQAIYGDG